MPFEAILDKLKNTNAKFQICGRLMKLCRDRCIIKGFFDLLLPDGWLLSKRVCAALLLEIVSLFHHAWAYILWVFSVFDVNSGQHFLIFICVGSDGRLRFLWRLNGMLILIKK